MRAQLHLYHQREEMYHHREQMYHDSFCIITERKSFMSFSNASNASHATKKQQFIILLLKLYISSPCILISFTMPSIHIRNNNNNKHTHTQNLFLQSFLLLFLFLSKLSAAKIPTVKKCFEFF